MKALILLCAWMGFAGSLYSQKLDRFVVATAGNTASNANLTLSYTIGETVVTTAGNSSLTLTQGFQQPDDILVGVPELPSPGLSYTLYPNPAQHTVLLQRIGHSHKEVHIAVYNTVGQLTHQSEWHAGSSPGATCAIQVDHWAAGTYWVVLRDPSNGLIESIPLEVVH